jgi:hypothetical protein
MKLRVLLIFAFALNSTVPAVLAHYEDAKSSSTAWERGLPGGSNRKNLKSNAPSIDPWKLLELAISPAYATASGVSITIEGPYRVVRSTGLPDHATGQFPNRGNPNRISEQDYHFRMPLKPVENGYSTPLPLRQSFGVALNGIPFDPGANEFWHNDRSSGWQYEAMSLGPRLGLDQNNAHVQPNGAYHYHGLPAGLLDELTSSPKPVLLGYAADGFPIYAPSGHSDPKNSHSALQKLHSSYRLKSGTRPDGPGGQYDGLFVRDYEYVPGLGDLDDCNGRFAVTSEYPQGTYHYVITDNFPYIPRAFRGTPDPSFNKSRPNPGPGRGGPPGPPVPPPFPPFGRPGMPPPFPGQ